MKRKNKEHREKSADSRTAYVFTKETMGMTLLLFSALVTLMLLTGSSVFAGIGKAVCIFMYGSFGYGSLLIAAVVAYFGQRLLFGRRIKLSFKIACPAILGILALFLLFHSATSRNFSLESYGGYISDCYKSAEGGFGGYTFGGVISALIVFPFAKLTTFVGSYVIFSLMTVMCGYFLVAAIRKGQKKPKGYSNGISDADIRDDGDGTEDKPAPPAVRNIPAATSKPERTVAAAQPEPRRQTDEDEDEDDNNPYSRKNLGRKILFAKGEFDAESYRRNRAFYEDSYFNKSTVNEVDYMSNFTDKRNTVPKQSYVASYQDDVLNQPVANAPSNYVYGDKPVEVLGDFDKVSGGTFPTQPEPEILQSFADDISSEPDKGEEETYRADTARGELFGEPEEFRGSDSEENDRSKDNPLSLYNLFGANSRTENRIEPDISRLSGRRTENSASTERKTDENDRDSERRQLLSKANLFDDDKQDDETAFDPKEPRFTEEPRPLSRMQDISISDNILSRGRAAERDIQPIPAEPKPVIREEKPKHVWSKYVRPGLDLLDDYPEHSNVNAGEIDDNKRTIVETLLKFKIESEVSNVIIGPAVTRYDVVIEDKTKITQSLKYKEAVAMALMKDNVTAYLNYTKGALSIEVPNNHRTIVGLKGMLASPKFINCKQNSITFALGKNVEGEAVCSDITKMPHLLIAGTTGSGKSICLSALIVSLLYKYGPEELRFILVDPKQVEFISYDKLPHLMINEIIYEVDKAIKALNWAIKEMERRYSLFKEMTENGFATKNLDEYNAHLPEGEEKLPKIVIILDEFGDLMLQAKKDIEGRIIKLVQKARACGIHLILATQRPSVDCITGLIKSNLPTRIGFKVNSFDDARTIFDIGGAEKLLGRGDMYFRSAESPDLARIQGCFIDTHEVQRVTDFVKAHNETYFDQEVSDFINTVEPEEPVGGAMVGDDGVTDGGDIKIDDTYIKALYYCVTSNQASVSMIQRRFPVGYIKACKIIDWMENMNYVTQSEGSKPRKVLLSKEEFINTYGEVDD